MRAGSWLVIGALASGCDCGTWVWGGGEATVTFAGGDLVEPRAWTIPGAEQDVVDRVASDVSGQVPLARGALVALQQERDEPARYALRAARMLKASASPCADGDRLLEVTAQVDLAEDGTLSPGFAHVALGSAVGDGLVRTLDTGDVDLERVDGEDTRWDLHLDPVVWRESGGSLYACELVEPERVEVHWDLAEDVRGGRARSCNPVSLFDFSIGL